MAATDGNGDGNGRSRSRIGLVAAGLGALAATPAGAENVVDFKFLHYGESGGRTQVSNPEIYFTHDFGEKGQIGLLLGYDSISGASPTGETATLDATSTASSAAGGGRLPMASYSDTRSSASVSYSRRFGSHLPTLTLSYSHESDYLSNGFSLVDAWDLFGGRSTLHLGFGTSRDRIIPANLKEQLSKSSQSFSIGWTQVLGPRDLVDFSLGVDRLNGYLNDPYKLVTVAGVAMPEARPDSRNRMSAVIKYGHYFLTRGALKASYRYYWDDWSVKAHTLDLSYDQRVGPRWIVTPRLRFYDQQGASFYGYEFQSPEPYMSGDYRLSSFRSWLAGIGLTLEVNDRLSFNAAVSYLDQTGSDRYQPKSLTPVLLRSRTGVMLDDEEGGGEGAGKPGLISPADLKTLTGTLGFTIKF